MKTKTIIMLAALLCFAGNSQAESNPFQGVLDSAIHDGAIVGGGWRSTTGNYTIYSYDYLYSITSGTNGLGAGLLAGGDCIQARGQSTWNDVKGGFTVNYQFNLGVIGLTNTVFKVYAGNAIATPRNSNVGVGNISFVGIDYSINVFKKVLFHVSPAYQSRTGQGEFDRNYLGIQAGLSLGGGTASMLAANDRYLEYAYANLAPQDF